MSWRTRRIQDVWTDFWPARVEDKTVIKRGVEDPLAAGQEPGHWLAGDGSLCIVKGSPQYELKVFHPYTTTSDVLTTDQNERDLHDCKQLGEGCLEGQPPWRPPTRS